jgi:hypothetical protein
MDRFTNHPRELGDSCRAHTETPSKAHPRAQAHTYKILMDRFTNHPRELGDSCRTQTETPSKAHPRAQAHILIKFSWIDLLIIQGNWGTPVGPRNCLKPTSPAHGPQIMLEGQGCHIYIKDSGIIYTHNNHLLLPSPLSPLQLT